MRFPKFPIVEVIWHDAYSDDGWHEVQGEELVHVYSVGRVIRDGESELILALNSILDCDDKEPHSCVMHIPKGMIKKIRYIRGKNEAKP